MHKRVPTYVIAEMACSHDGNETLARTIIDCAGINRADAIQFQVWKKEEIATPDHPDMDVLSQLELTQDIWRSLASYVRTSHPHMDIIACVYEDESLQFCNAVGVDAFKIHAADITNLQFLVSVGKTGKRVDLSVGACTIDEILRASETLQASGCPEVWLMYGLQNFPTPPADVDLAYMLNLEKITGFPTGYQDHSPPEDISSFSMVAAAIGQGTAIIEKHITHDRALKGADHQAALNPDEFITFMQMVHDLDSSLSGGTLRPLTEAEKKYRSYSRKSLVASRHLKESNSIQESDIKVLRARTYGIDPGERASLIGRKINRDIEPNDVLFEEDFA